MIIAWLSGIIGPKAAKPFLWGLGILALVALGFTLSRCSQTDPAPQIEQSTRSADAYTNAVEFAVDTVDNRTLTESALKEATVVVKDEIGNAASLSEIRTSLVTRLCQQPSHRSDPACVR